jgi:predicted esterase
MGIKDKIIQFANRNFLTPDIPKRGRGVFAKEGVNSMPLDVGFLEGGQYGYRRAIGGKCVVAVNQLGCSFEYLTDLAQVFADREVSFVSLDYNGLRTGDKEGRININRTIDDVSRVVGRWRGYSNELFLVGSCFGADVAYVTAMESSEKIDGIVMHAPKMPFERNELKEFLPRTYVIQHDFWSKIAKWLRETDRISLSDAMNDTFLNSSTKHTLFEQEDVREYLNKKPAQFREDIPLNLIGGSYDCIVPLEHTRALYDVLSRRHPGIEYKELESDHYLFRKQPSAVADFVQRGERKEELAEV